MASKKKIILYSLLFLLIVLFGVSAFYYLIILPSRILLDTSEQIAYGIAEAFNFSPRITVKNTIVVEEQAAIFEVALYSQRFVYDYEYSNTWMGSTKELHLRGVYQAKYGFNLKDQKFSVSIAEDDSLSGSVYNLTFAIPEPILLSFETENYRIIQDRDGWWNKFNKTEREIAVNRLRGAAREKASSADYGNKVKDSIESQLKVIMAELPLDIKIGQLNFIWQGKNLDGMNIRDDKLELK